MPSAKRARQRAAKQAKQAEIQRQKRRRQTRNRTIIAVVAVAAAIGIYFATSSGSSKAVTKKPSLQAAADTAAAAAGCPSNPKTAVTKKSYSSAPPMTIDTSDTYVAAVKTAVGTFDMTLDASSAPTAVNNFVFLAKQGFYNCTTFWRAGSGFMIQGGDPTGKGTGGPGYQFTEAGPPTAANSSDQYPLGSVAMANSSASGDTDPSTNGSQFFVIEGPSGEALPPDYVLFGHVTSGMSVVDKIAAEGGTATDNYSPPKVTYRMLKVTITTS